MGSMNATSWSGFVINVGIAFTLLAGACNARAQTASLRLLTTITNPAPALHDHFGESLAAMGSDLVVIGAPNDKAGPSAAGAAYLYSCGGEFQTVFTNSTPNEANNLGFSVAVLGNDKVLIGAIYDSTAAASAGGVYMYGTNGLLLKTITSPQPEAGEGFGWSIVGLGDEQFVVGAPFKSSQSGNAYPGATYLMNTNGSMISRMDNPLLVGGGESGQFGRTVSAVDQDLIVVGAPNHRVSGIDAGAAFVFSANGTWITTLANPTPNGSDKFGSSVAALPGDRVVVGDPSDEIGGPNAGAVYFFNTNGIMLLTVTNPQPATVRGFGISLAGMNGDKLLVGAYHWSGDSSSSLPGTVFVFTHDGSLLTSVTSPNPSGSDYFGFSVSSAGSNRVIVGAPGDDIGAEFAGAVYLFELVLAGPRLSLVRDQSTMHITWPAAEADWALQQTEAIDDPDAWLDLNLSVTAVDGTNGVAVNVLSGDSLRAFRLRSTVQTP